MAQARIYEAAVTLDVSLRLTEQEARALEALTAYGIEPFIKTFYDHMGTSCLRPHEKGLRSLFDVVRGEVSPMLERAKTARAAFDEKRG